MNPVATNRYLSPDAISPRVRVHFNLHTKLWSVTSRGRVIAHAPSIALTDCHMIVSEAGRRRCLARRQRSVHAWVEGTPAKPLKTPPAAAREFTYNPYRAATFTLRTGQPITQSPACFFCGRQAFALTEN